MKRTPYYILIPILALSMLSGCGSDQSQTSSEETSQINIRLHKDPQYVNALFSPSAVGKEIFQYIFLPCADFDPKDLKLIPVLIEDLPKGVETMYGGKEAVSFDLTFRKEAQWSDGHPVTPKDYVFTLNAIVHPQSKITAYKPFYQYLLGMETDAENPRKVTVYYDRSFMLSLESAVNAPLLPAHVYDEQGMFGTDFLAKIKTEGYAASDSTEIHLLEKLNASPTQKIDVVQSGPYNLTATESNQYYLLEKKPNYWGAALQDIPNLNANIDKIMFTIVPEEVTALTMAKEGKLDLMIVQSSHDFLDMKNDDNHNEKWTFNLPQLFRYYYIAINNKSDKLNSPEIRNALAHLADVDDYIKTLDNGFGIRTTGHFHPSKAYYNDTVKPVVYDLSASEKLLDEVGWQITAGDSYRSKSIAGRKVPLELDLLITGSPLSKNMALMYQEEAKKVGIKINLVTKKTSLMRKENLHDYKYDLALLVNGTSESHDDPYPKFHSDNVKPGGSNFCGYSNPAVDKMIDELRLTLDEEARFQIYRNIQAQMYADMPVIFLYCPMRKIIISDKFRATTTTKRPGYLANTFVPS